MKLVSGKVFSNCEHWETFDILAKATSMYHAMYVLLKLDGQSRKAWHPIHMALLQAIAARARHFKSITRNLKKLHKLFPWLPIIKTEQDVCDYCKGKGTFTYGNATNNCYNCRGSGKVDPYTVYEVDMNAQVWEV